MRIDQIKEIVRAACAEYKAQKAGKPETVRVLTEQDLFNEAWMDQMINLGFTEPQDWPEGMAEQLTVDTESRLMAGVARLLLAELTTVDADEYDNFPDDIQGEPI